MARGVGGGRPPKPIEEKRRTGNPGQRKLPAESDTVALEPAAGIPPVPITLGEVGRAVWNRLWASEAHRWMSPSTDGLAISALCHISDEIDTYRQLAEAEPILEEPIVTPTGVIVGTKKVANPAVKMLRDAMKQSLEVQSTLGLNPTARSRLGLAEVRRQSKLEELLRGRNGHEEGREVIDAQVIEIASDG